MAKRMTDRYPSVASLPEDEHIRVVQEIFATIPEKYDFLNRLMSLRRDVLWRRFTIRKMCYFKTNRFLDLATGTADLAIEASQYHRQINVIGLDLVLEMMNIGKKKIQQGNLENRVRLVQGDALHLPFADDHFDCAAIAFGIRNIPDRVTALQEMRRIVVPGGQVMILEMNYPRTPVFTQLYGFYLRRIMPRLARLFSPNPDAYTYLADSIIHFPSPSDFAGLMANAGLENIRQYPLTLGTTYLHIGVKRSDG